MSTPNKHLFFFFVLFFLFSCSGEQTKQGLKPQPAPFLAINLSPDAQKIYEAYGKRFIVAAQGTTAGQAAKSVIEKGGNLVDAAIAASFAISVERPQSTGLGGGGFFLYYEAKTKKTYAVDFRERAPLLARKNMYLDERGNVVAGKSLRGIFAVATPGLVAGLTEIHSKFGKLPFAEDVEPAIQLAEKGFPIYSSLAENLEKFKDTLASFPATKLIFLHRDGSPLQENELLVQKDLANTLRIIAKNKRDGFYKGKIARAILQESSKRGGLLQFQDFSQYQVKWRSPLEGSFLNYKILTMPPPSSGGIHVLQILNILEAEPFSRENFLSAESIHRTASAMQLAFADRAVYPGDPDFVNVPTETLISKKYALQRRALIGERAAKASEIAAGKVPAEESLQTTHFSMMDSEGNAIASTQTINYIFGSGVVVPGTGIVLNDEMDDFSVKPGAANIFGAVGGEANSIAPKRTPLSSMSPTIILENGQTKMAVGAPGGTFIITCVAQAILNYLAHHQSLYQSVAAPRFHQQWLPDQLMMETPGFSEDILENLKNRGHNIKMLTRHQGCYLEAVSREADILHGVADPRDIGISLGL